MLQACKRIRSSLLPCRLHPLPRSFAAKVPKSAADKVRDKKEAQDSLESIELAARLKTEKASVRALQKGELDEEAMVEVEFKLFQEWIEEQAEPDPIRKPLPRLLVKDSWTKRLANTPEGTHLPPATATEILKKDGAQKVKNAIHKGVQQALSGLLPDPSLPLPPPPPPPPSLIRRNAAGVQLLSPSLHTQLFPGPPLPKPPSAYTKISLSHLADNGLKPEAAAVLPEISFTLPALQGPTIKAHFERLGLGTAEPYLSLSKELAGAKLPPQPLKWETGRPGWTRYRDGKVEEVLDLGGEGMVVFDVEVLYRVSPFAVMAIAASPTAWYSWLSPSIFASPAAEGEESPPSIPKTLIPMGKSTPENPMIVVGHNIGYDRARILDEYHLRRSSLRFLDTLSLHATTKGITSVQRPAWLMQRKRKLEKRDAESTTAAVLEREGEILEDFFGEDEDKGSGGDAALGGKWEDLTSMNSLKAVAELHCGIVMDKSIRDVFGDEALKSATDLRPQLDSLLTYCANDVSITHSVLSKTLPLFLSSCPHPASFSGQLTMGSSFLPVDKSWKEYLQNAEAKYRELEGGVKGVLWELAGRLRRRGRLEGDTWSEQLDWAEKKGRWEDVDEVEGMGRGLKAGSEMDEVEVPVVGSSSAGEVLDLSSGAVSSLSDTPSTTSTTPEAEAGVPRWVADHHANGGHLNPTAQASSLGNIMPLLARVSCHGYPIFESREHRWMFRVPQADQELLLAKGYSAPLAFNQYREDRVIQERHPGFVFFPISEERMVKSVLSPTTKALWNEGVLASPFGAEADSFLANKATGSVKAARMKAATGWFESMKVDGRDTAWGQQLDWSVAGSLETTFATGQTADVAPADIPVVTPKKGKRSKAKPFTGTWWPKWYWDLAAPKAGKIPLGELDLSITKKITPLLLRLQWMGYPLFYSAEYKWIYRIPKGEATEIDQKNAVVFGIDPKVADKNLVEDREGVYRKLPHADGSDANVGNPLSKNFQKYVDQGVLTSAPPLAGEDDGIATAAAEAIAMNGKCSYWVGSRNRIMEQMALYGKDVGPIGEGAAADPELGMILPQVVTMGTVTRRAIETTWLTASNAKKNRLGSELKAMIKAPPGYAIVGADVDSEELWIASVMGDAQFGMHGATAIGWMTLEGTKSAGTDLHSKTAKILATSRDNAKVFNYSRIYGAGERHAVKLLRKNDSALAEEKAKSLAKDLYFATKGKKTWSQNRNGPMPTMWHGGSESYLFNTLEAVAGNILPQTPALGCGVTDALKKAHLPVNGDFGSDYLPSRINWAVQSSGVDYLHLLIVSMEYLIERYKIQARYMISVHDEVRYLVKEEDRYRAAMALQVANAWTRALFCYRMGLDDVPQGVAFFSAVDIDHVFRKEVDMPCVTPSQSTPIPPGESLDIMQLLAKPEAELSGATELGEKGIWKPELKMQELPEIPPLADVLSPRHLKYLTAQASKTPGAAQEYMRSLTKGMDEWEGYDGGPWEKRGVGKKGVVLKSFGGKYKRTSEDADWNAVSEVEREQRSHG